MGRKPAKRGVRHATANTPGGKENGQAAGGTNGSGSASTVKDPFHNGQTPACQLLVHASQDVFPELREYHEKGSAATATPKAVVHNPINHTTTDSDDDVDDDLTLFQANRSDNDNDNNNKSSTRTGSLFGQMLRWYVIQRRQEEAARNHRQQRIQQQQQKQQGDGVGSFDGNATNEDEDEDALTPPMAGGSKKKRKKKKKKKGGPGGGESSEDQQRQQQQEQPSEPQQLQQQHQQHDDASFAGTFGTFEGDDWPENGSHPHGSVTQLNSSFSQHLKDHSTTTTPGMTTPNRNRSNSKTSIKHGNSTKLNNNNIHHDDDYDDTYMGPLNNSISQLSATPSTEELLMGGVDTLDQSLHRHESRLRELKSSRMPKLDSLPADDMIVEENDEKDYQVKRPQHHPNPSLKGSPTMTQPGSDSNNHHNDHDDDDDYTKDIINRNIPAPNVMQRAARDNAERPEAWNQDDIAQLHSSTHFFQQILPQEDDDDDTEGMVDDDGLSFSGQDFECSPLPRAVHNMTERESSGGDHDESLTGEGMPEQAWATPTKQVHKTANGNSNGDSDTVESPKYGSLTTPTKLSSMDRRSRSLSVSSVGATSNNGKSGRPPPPATPTHELIPPESAITVAETPPAEVIKNPLLIPYLLTLAFNEAPWTMTIEGRHVPTSPFEQRKVRSVEKAAAAAETSPQRAANPQENPQTGVVTPPAAAIDDVRVNYNGDNVEGHEEGQQQQPRSPPPPPPPPLLPTMDPFDSEMVLNDLPPEQPEKSIVDEWLDRVIVGEQPMATQQLHSFSHSDKNASILKSPLPYNRDLESFLGYLQKRFHSSTDPQHHHQQQGNSTNTKGVKLQQQQPQRQLGAGISVSSIVNACNDIDCSHCRDSAIEFLNRIQESIAVANNIDATTDPTSGHSGKVCTDASETASTTSKIGTVTTQRHCCLVLNPETLELVRKEDNIVLYSPELQQEEDMAVQAAFDYVALEEGHHVPPPAKSSAISNENDDVVVVVGGEQEPSVNVNQFISFLPSNDSFGSRHQHSYSPPGEDAKTANNGSNSKNAKKTITGQQKLNRDDELYIQLLGWDQIESLVHHWLPCGMEEDTLVAMTNIARRNGQAALKEDSSEFPSSSRKKDQPLEPGELRDIQVKVMDNLERVRKSLDELEQLGNDLQQDFNKLLESVQTKDNNVPNKAKYQNKNLELKTFPLLNECDKKSVSYMEKILHVLRVTTSERSNALQEVQFDLWIHYLRKLGGALLAGDKYYTSVAEEMADQLGFVPQMFVSAPLRNLYQTMVEQKVQEWTDLGRFFSSKLTSSVLKEWYTRQAWQEQRTSGDSICSSRSSLDDDEASAAMMLDEWCHDLISSVSQWTATILGSNVAEIQRGRMKQTEQVLDLLQSINEPLSKEYATVERFFDAKRNHYFASLRSNISLAQGVKKKMRLIDQTEVEHMATGVILMWRHVRIMQSRMKNATQDPPLPPQLARWMKSEDGVDAGIIEGFDWRAPNHLCLIGAGRGGKRRVMCVLAGLVYQWLEERCLEWNAELAEQELLTSMDTDHDTAADVRANAAVMGSSDPKNKTSKASKKNKKKREKNKTTISTSTSPINGAPEATLDNPANLDVDANINNGSSIPLEDGSPLATSGEYDNAVTADKEPLTEDVPRKEALTDQAPDQELEGELEAYETFDSNDGAYEEEEFDNFDEHGIDLGHPSAVGVIDSDDFQSPEEFLVGRFKEVLRLRGNKDVLFL